MNIIISSESTCDLSPEIIEKYNISIIPLGVTLGEKTYSDGVNIKPDDIYEHHRSTGELPKTTTANIGEYTDYFNGLKDKADAIIHITLSSDFSSAYNNVRIAAAEFDNVYVIDSRNLSTGIGLSVVAAAKMAQNGIAPQEIIEKIEAMVPCVDASFVIDSLDYLHKGGRCSALSVLGANVLKLKPCIEVKKGKMDVGKKYRGKYSAVLKEYVAERLSDLNSIDKTRIFITHAGVDIEIINDLYEQVKALGYFDEILITQAGCTISSHCGQNTLGVLFVRKSPIA